MSAFKLCEYRPMQVKNPMHVLIREPVSPSLQMWQCWARKRELFVIVSHSVSFKVLVLKLSLPSWWHYEGPYKNAKWKRKWRRSAKQNEYVYVREGNCLWGSSPIVFSTKCSATCCNHFFFMMMKVFLNQWFENLHVFQLHLIYLSLMVKDKQQYTEPNT